MIIANYPAKDYAEFTTADRRAARRFSQGYSHAKQGRTDLKGQCPHYDAGFDTQTGDRPCTANYVDYATYCIDRSQQGFQGLPRALFDAVRKNHFVPA